MSNEAKTTKAYKISPELKEKLERLAAESGLETQEAFVEQMAALYELQRLKEGNGAGYAKQIEELEYHARRSAEIISSVINTEAAARLEMSQQHDEKQAAAARELFAAQQEIQEQRAAAKAQAEQLAKLTKETEAQSKLVEQLQESVRDKGVIVEQRGQEITTLSGIVNQYQAAAEENKGLKTELTELSKLTEQQAARIANLENDLRITAERQTEALERLSERKDTEKEREALALERQYEAKLSKEREDATTKLVSLHEQLASLNNQLREAAQPKQQTRKAADSGEAKK